MAYNGYLLKVGNYEITGQKYIKYDSYEVTKEVQDMDSYRDANGVLHRNALTHIPYKVTLSTVPNLTNAEISQFLSGIKTNFTNALERKATVTAYIPEDDTYITQEMYMTGPTLKITQIDQKTNTVKYNSCKISFIGY